MSDAYLGIVRLPLGDRTIALQFTLGRVAVLGRQKLVEKLTVATEGAETDGEVIAELLEIASGGEVTAEALKAEVVSMDGALLALHKAWAYARFGPTGKPADQREGNPLSRLRTSLLTLWRRVRGRG